jgi:hypothetical protein
MYELAITYTMKAFLLFLCLFAAAIFVVPHTDVAERAVQALTTY